MTDAKQACMKYILLEFIFKVLTVAVSLSFFFTIQLNWTPLHIASEEGHAEVVQALLIKGASKEALDKVKYIL